jgi:hypothetical protein
MRIGFLQMGISTGMQASVYRALTTLGHRDRRRFPQWVNRVYLTVRGRLLAYPSTDIVRSAQLVRLVPHAGIRSNEGERQLRRPS